MRCPHCSRKFRSRAAYELFQRRAALRNDLLASMLQMPPSAECLLEQPSVDNLSKHERHRLRSEDFRAGRT